MARYELVQDGSVVATVEADDADRAYEKWKARQA